MNTPTRDDVDLQKISSFTVELARDVGRLLVERIDSGVKFEFKGAVDLVTEMDLIAEEKIISAIKADFPGHGILTEERTEELTGSPCRWVIDPIDGTTNYAHGFPVFSVSIAFEVEGDVLFGVVYDPTRDELFTGEKGAGAFLNGETIRVSAIDSLDHSLLGTGFPYDIRTSSETNLDHFSRFAVRAQAIRRAGSAALDLCYVASGRFDGFWELKLRPWDIAAASLIVKEAGGRVTDFEGNPSGLENSRLLASNSLIHSQMSDLLTSSDAQ